MSLETLANPPETLQALNEPVSPGPISGDIEHVLWWAFAQTGHLPWRNPTNEDLALDHGWDACGSAMRAMYQPSGGIALKVKGGMPMDARIIVAAVRGFPARMASLVIDHAREKSRPNALVGIDPVQVATKKYGKRRNGKRRGRPITVMVWKPCDPAAICAAREAYSLWHEGMRRVMAVAADELTYCRISGFAAPVRPWEAVTK